MAKTLSNMAYDRITRMIQSPEWTAGKKISEPTLAAACGISRTPAREAIRRLTEEGILYRIPSSGTYIAPVSRRDLTDAYEVRMAVECAMLDTAVPRMTPPQLRALRRCCDAMYRVMRHLRYREQSVLKGRPLVTFLSNDFSFHLILLKASGNRLALKTVASVYQRNRSFGQHSHQRDLKHLAWVWRHHAKIEAAVRHGDTERARYWMRAHIARSLQDALGAFDRASGKHAAGTQRNPVSQALDKLTGRFA